MSRITNPTAKRLSEYLLILERLSAQGTRTLSSRELADLYGNTASQVRQDIFSLPRGGESDPYGYDVDKLGLSIRHALGMDALRSVAVVGCGRLGTTLALHVPLEDYGMKLAAAFDVHPDIVGTRLKDVHVEHSVHIPRVCRQEQIELAALSTPAEEAQKIADALVHGGVKGILNFTRVQLRLPDSVVAENRQIVCGFIQLAHKVSDLNNDASADALSDRDMPS